MPTPNEDRESWRARVRFEGPISSKTRARATETGWEMRRSNDRHPCTLMAYSLGAERSLVQIQSPRLRGNRPFATAHPPLNPRAGSNSGSNFPRRRNAPCCYSAGTLAMQTVVGSNPISRLWRASPPPQAALRSPHSGPLPGAGGAQRIGRVEVVSLQAVRGLTHLSADARPSRVAEARWSQRSAARRGPGWRIACWAASTNSGRRSGASAARQPQRVAPACPPARFAEARDRRPAPRPPSPPRPRPHRRRRSAGCRRGDRYP
jgi:hypothetical protein